MVGVKLILRLLMVSIFVSEMYPTNPMRAGTSGDTERVIGKWSGIKVDAAS